MAARGRTQQVLLTLGLAVVAFVVWVVGIVGIGQFGEDICIADAPAAAGGYQTDASVLPPRVTCVYDLADGDVVRVGHPVYAFTAAGWLIGFPVAAIVGIGVLAVVVARRRSRDHLVGTAGGPAPRAGPGSNPS